MDRQCEIYIYVCVSYVCVYTHTHICMCMLSCFSHVQLFATLMDYSLPSSPVHGFSRQEYWSGLPRPPLGDLPDPGIESTSLTSPALASRFFTTRVTWEAVYTHTQTHTQHKYTVAYDSVIKKDEILAPMWINLENIIHSEISQTNTLYHLHVDLKTKTNELHSKTNKNRRTDVGNKPVATNEERKGVN